MHRLLLVPAAALIAAIPALPAQAADRSGSVRVSDSDSRFRGDFRCETGRRDHDGRRDGSRDRRSRGDCVFVGGNLGYLDYGDYDANRSFNPNLWNDWWHDRPDRAYPRWVQEQRGGNCTEDRMWWSGSGWHC